jgi:IclR helix-turn-helix domain
MTRDDDGHEPSGAPARPRLLAPGLTILAQFDNERTALNRTEIARLTGFPVSIARRYLLMLCDLGYLNEDCDGSFSRVDAESGPIRARRNDDGTQGSAA